jgi:hypothetical protein
VFNRIECRAGSDTVLNFVVRRSRSLAQSIFVFVVSQRRTNAARFAASELPRSFTLGC